MGYFSILANHKVIVSNEVSLNICIRHQNHKKPRQCQAVENRYMLNACLKVFCDKSGDHNAGNRLFQVVGALMAKLCCPAVVRACRTSTVPVSADHRYCRPELAVAANLYKWWVWPSGKSAYDNKTHYGVTPTDQTWYSWSSVKMKVTDDGLQHFAAQHSNAEAKWKQVL